jgi:hypothetical protein
METESGLTRATTLIALTCFLVVGAAVTSFLVVGAAVTSILGGDGVPEAASAAVQNPVANTQNKQDRRAPATMAMAAYEPPQAMAAYEPPPAVAAYEPPQTVAALSEPLRQAYASTSPADIEMPSMIAAPASVPHAPTKPKVASKPPVQKSYALLSDGQIAGIKERLKLSSSQESYWPAVENALRAVARKIHATRQTDPNATGAPIDPDAEEVQQLKSAAMPLLYQLREDQKREVRALARMIGLEKVASMI